MKTSAFVPLLSAAIAAASPHPAPAATNPDPAAVRVLEVAYGGSGCPQGTLNLQLRGGTIISNEFNDFVANLGPGSQPADHRKNCQIAVHIAHPPGFQYAVTSSDYNGYIGLSDGATGTVKSTYYYSGQTDQISSQIDFKGPLFTQYHQHSSIQTARWSPCGGDSTLNVNEQIRLNDNEKPNAYGFVSTDNGKIKVSHVVNLIWRNC